MNLTVEQLWETYRTQLYHFVLGRVGETAVSEDIVQDVFVKVQTQLPKLREQEKVTAWLYQITRNAITDYYRRRRPIAELTEAIPAIVEEEATAAEELAGCLRPFVNQLAPSYRDAITLYEFEGMPQKEIANQLGISLPGVKSRIQRGRKQLKASLLNCCQIEQDRFGAPIAFQPHCDCTS